ncbi:hypothetical protein F2Q70_00007406 [Brassica cretica]|uniref:aspartate kinase n=1 Tax=Brassica cretica TaxID=69181 RepID=A0A8S9LZ69_BRACR|nr:hypothetical protein F2Q70_00007406 [Brassica cretica]
MLTDTPGLSATLKKLLVRAVVFLLWGERNSRLHNGSPASTSVLFKINYLSYIITRESNLFMCLFAEMMFLSSLSMPWNTVAAERLITTIPTRDEEEAEADGDEVDGKSTTDEFDDDLDKDPTYEPESDSVKGGDKTEDMVEDVAFKLTSFEVLFWKAKKLYILSYRVSFGDALIVPLFEHIKVSSVDEFICFCCWQYDAFEIWFITSDDFTNADILEATYPAVSKMLLISNWSKDNSPCSYWLPRKCFYNFLTVSQSCYCVSIARLLLISFMCVLISQGASKVNISLIVNDEEAEQCVRALPSAFFETFS